INKSFIIFLILLSFNSVGQVLQGSPQAHKKAIVLSSKLDSLKSIYNSSTDNLEKSKIAHQISLLAYERIAYNPEYFTDSLFNPEDWENISISDQEKVNIDELENRADYFYDLGKKKYSNGNYDQAIQLYKKSIDNGQTDSFVYAKIAQAYRKINDWKNASDYFDIWKKMNPEDNSLDLIIGHTKSKLK
ncbi:MAG: hypothetical protein MRY83_18380, partial [Flavobacteriales bacterium]|nr:hypothetical protein [Flavobacteriales bacterium]